MYASTGIYSFERILPRHLLPGVLNSLVMRVLYSRLVVRFAPHICGKRPSFLLTTVENILIFGAKQGWCWCCSSFYPMSLPTLRWYSSCRTLSDLSTNSCEEALSSYVWWRDTPRDAVAAVAMGDACRDHRLRQRHAYPRYEPPLARAMPAQNLEYR
jgi:hypothetical protein